MAAIADAHEVPLRHICEVCGKDELLTPSVAFDGGWDYPPRMGSFGVISPRTCGSCGIESTLWWALAVSKISPEMLTDTQLKTLARIQGEPETILPQS